MATVNEPHVIEVYESITGTWQYIVADTITKRGVIIDPVLDYNKDTGLVHSRSADQLLELVKEHQFTINRILETHAHADHLSSSRYLQSMLSKRQKTLPPPAVCIGRRIEDVQQRMGEILSIEPENFLDSFDQTFSDDEIFNIGSLKARVVHLPGHTPDHIGYIIGSNVFTGDSIFNPDVGSARCDFPGGSATHLHQSMTKLLSLPDDFKLYTGHDYPPSTRDKSIGVTNTNAVPFTTVKMQREENKHAKRGISQEEFVRMRSERDSGLAEPKLLRQSLHVNLRGGRFPSASTEEFKFVSEKPGLIVHVKSVDLRI